MNSLAIHGSGKYNKIYYNKEMNKYKFYLAKTYRHNYNSFITNAIMTFESCILIES